MAKAMLSEPSLAAFIMNVTGLLSFDEGGLRVFPKYIRSIKRENLKWSAGWPTDLYMELLMAESRTITLTCFVKPLEKKHQVKSVSCLSDVFKITRAEMCTEIVAKVLNSFARS